MSEVVITEQKVEIKNKSLSLRTKVFTLIICSLLVLPVLIYVPNKNGQVLGVQEDRTGQIQTNTSINGSGRVQEPEKKSSGISMPFSNIIGGGEQVKQSQLGNIGSGIQDENRERLVKIDSILDGNIVWDEKASTSVASDKFPLASGVVVEFNGKPVNLVINDVRVLPAKDILVVDKQTFIKIGGDPNTQKSINVVVRQDN